VAVWVGCRTRWSCRKDIVVDAQSLKVGVYVIRPIFSVVDLIGSPLLALRSVSVAGLGMFG
jgi:hypothetical protein